MAANTGVEWVGGLVKVPAYVAGDEAPYRPEALFWMDTSSGVLSSKVAKPGELLSSAAASLRNAMERPMLGDAHAPTRIRVASRELATELRSAFPAIEIVCAPTPEIDAFLTIMRERFDQDAEDEQSYLAGALSVEAVSSFFHSTASLFRAQPWQSVPSEQNAFYVTIEALGLEDAVLCVIGQLAESIGLILFANHTDFTAYLAVADALAQGKRPPLPQHLALQFERGAELPTSMRKEIVRHSWEVAAADAYPRLMAMDEDFISRAPTAVELATAEALALAVPTLLSTAKHELLTAWRGGIAASHVLEVHAHAGPVTIELRVAQPALPRLNG